jgi:hypothetical protein
VCVHRFGYLYEEFSTIRQSLITQFAILVGDSTPDYSSDSMMCIYVVAFVFVCSLSLLNFFLAIVVNGAATHTSTISALTSKQLLDPSAPILTAPLPSSLFSPFVVLRCFAGYTKVTERVLENQVAQSFAADALLVPMDVILWLRNKRWPSKLAILNSLYLTYPDVFEDEAVGVVRALPQERFREVVIAAAGKKGASAEDGDRIFEHYCRLVGVLMAAAGGGERGGAAWPPSSPSPGKAVLLQ